MTHFQIYGWIIVVVLVCSFFYGCYMAVKHIIKVNSNQPLPLPIQRYRTPTPTIETQYGRDLLKVSTEIFIKNLDSKMHPEDRAQCSVLSAVNLLSEVGEVCHKKDLEKAEKTRELFKQAAKP